MLGPHDYVYAAIHHPVMRALVAKVEFRHGGPEYDAPYPDGIPTSVTVEGHNRKALGSGLVMYPGGHARYTEHNLQVILNHKFRNLAFVESEPLAGRLLGMGGLSAAELHNFPLREYDAFKDTSEEE